MSISLRLAVPPTDEEIRTFSASNPGYQFERMASGELVVTPTGSESGRCEAELITQLSNWAKADGAGVVFSSATGFRLPDGSLLVPDASWVRRERWESLTPMQREGFSPLCPDAVFEILPHDHPFYDLRAKMPAYVANGARLAVLIDRQRRAVEIYAPDRDPRVLEPAQSASFDAVLPGFTLDLRPIFE